MSNLARTIFDADVTAPSVPTISSVVALSTTSLRINWNASADNVNGTGLGGYGLYRATSLAGTYALIQTLSASSISYDDTALNPGTQYFYKINAFDRANPVNVSAQSSSGSGTTNSAATGFDFYISPTGSDSNSGTLAQPWAYTAIRSKQASYAGKRVGFMPGTYDVSSLMTSDAQDGSRTPVLNINGGTSNSARTYLGSCDASGNYSRGTALIDAKGASGFFGGRNNSTNAVIGCANSVASRGFWTVDGLKFTGFSMWCFHIGNSPSGGVPPHDFTIQNCEIYGGAGTNSTVANGVNLGPIIVYGGVNGLITNNYIHDNVGWYGADTLHFSAVYQWGIANTATIGMVYSFNTIVNSGNLQGKEDQQYNTTISYNYIDMRGTAATGNVTACPIFGFMGDLGAGALTSIHHNVLIHRGAGISLENTNNAATYIRSRCAIYNNSLICADLAASDKLLGGYINTGVGGITRQVDCYNNGFYDNGNSASGYGYALTAIDLFGIYAYNQHGTWAKWNTVPDSSSTSLPITSYSTISAFVAAVGGGSNPAVNGANPFTNAGTYADQYQVLSGSIWFQTGHVGGVPGGAACNIGAFDGSGRPGASWVI